MTAEEYFATTFLNRSRKNRLLAELTKPRKRYRGLDRFCHGTPDLIDLRQVLMYGPDLERRPDFETFVKEHEETVTILSPEPAADLPQAPVCFRHSVQLYRFSVLPCQLSRTKVLSRTA